LQAKLKEQNRKKYSTTTTTQTTTILTTTTFQTLTNSTADNLILTQSVSMSVTEIFNNRNQDYYFLESVQNEKTDDKLYLTLLGILLIIMLLLALIILGLTCYAKKKGLCCFKPVLSKFSKTGRKAGHTKISDTKEGKGDINDFVQTVLDGVDDNAVLKSPGIKKL